MVNAKSEKKANGYAILEHLTWFTHTIAIKTNVGVSALMNNEPMVMSYGVK